MYYVIIKMEDEISFLRDYGRSYPYPPKSFTSEKEARLFMTTERIHDFIIIGELEVLRILC